MTAPGGGGDTRNANVVLTADTSQYQQQMSQSAQETNRLNTALGQITERLDGLSKRAGKRLLHFTATDFAALGVATATAATFEKQLGTLRATATITARDSGTAFNQIKNNIESAFTKFPVARGDVVALTEVISNLGVTSTKEIGKATETFIKLGAATGESSAQLASGLIQLGRTMGTSIEQTANYANSLLTVSKQAGVAASGVLNFSQAIAPLARQAGISEASVLGISTAFERAGANGYVAANTFNRIISDITNLIQTGSPELNRYSKLIGLSAEQFAKLDKTEGFIRIFEAISKQGPKAIQTLNQLGIEGIRAQAAISAVVQSGGLREQVAKAESSSHGTGTLEKGAAAAFEGVADELVRLRNNFTQLGTVIGTSFLTPLAKVLEIFNDLFESFNKFMKPLAPIISLLGALAGALSGVAAAALLTFAAVSKLALAGALIRPIQAFAGGAAIGRNPAATNTWAVRNAQGSLGFFSRNAFALGAGAGAMVPSLPSAIRQGTVLGLRAPFLVAGGLANMQTRFLQESATSPIFAGGLFRSQAAQERAALALKNAGISATPPGAATGPLAPIANWSKKMIAENQAVAASNARAGAIIATSSQTAAGQIAKLGATSAIAGAQMAAGFGGRVLGAAGRALASPLGITGALLLSPYIFKGIGKLKDWISGPDYSGAAAGNNITKYDTALGKSSTNLAVFSNAVTRATDKLNSLAGKPAEDVRRVTQSDTRTATANDYKVVDKNFRSFKGKDAVRAGVGYIQTLAAQHGGLDAQYLQQIKLDLINQTGDPEQAQRIINAYLATRDAGGSPLNINYRDLGTQARALNDEKAKELAGQVFTGAQSQYQLNKGRGSARAFLNAVLTYSSTAAAGRDRTDDSTETLMSQFKEAYGYDPFIEKSTAGGQGETYNQLLGSLLYIGNRRHGAKYKEKNLALLRQVGIKPAEIQAAFKKYSPLDDRQDPNDKSVEEYIGEHFAKQIQAGRFSNKLPTEERQAYQRTELGRYVLNTKSIQDVIGVGPDIANPKARFAAQQDLAKVSLKMNGNLDKSATALEKLANTAENEANPALASLARAAAASARQEYEATKLPTLSRSRQAEYYIRREQETKREFERSGTDTAREDYERAKQARQQNQEATRQYLISLYQMTRNYNVQTERAWEDYYTNVYRQTRDFNIQMAHAERDFNKQRYRMVRDFNIQIERQALQSAQNIYNPFQRVFTQQTADAETVLDNLRDQNSRIQEQLANLHRLQQMGVSQQTIDVLNLADPSNAQQLDNLVEGIMDNPQLVQSINNAVRTRQAATTGLVQSDFNATFRQTVEDFNRQWQDMRQDFDTSRNDAVEAFHRGLNDMADNFHLMLSRQADDFAFASREMTGSIEDMFTKAFHQVNGKLREFAPEAANIIQQQLDSLHLNLFGTEGAGSGNYSGDGSTGQQGFHAGPAGSTSNPITAPNTRGYNPEGVYGFYGSGGKFHAVSERTIPPNADPPHIAPPGNDQVYRWLHAAGWPAGAEETHIMHAIVHAESGNNPNAFADDSDDLSYGLAQINMIGDLGPQRRAQYGLKSNEELFNPVTNLRIAWAMSGHGHNFSPWTTYTGGAYLQYMDTGGVLKPGITHVMNATGQDELVLNPKQMQALHTVGKGTPATNVFKIYNNNSTVFKDITVMASDPNAMARQLQAQARLRKLTQPPRSTATLG